jgi:hypothetical protein
LNEALDFFAQGCENVFQCRTRVRKFRCAQMVGTILDFTPCNVLNVGTKQIHYNSKTQKKIITLTKTATNTLELFYVHFSLFWIDF